MPNLNFDQQRFWVDSFPGLCPRCHKSIESVFTGASVTKYGSLSEAVFSCPACKGFFVSFWKSAGNKNGLNALELVTSLPEYPTLTNFDEIDALSPQFSKIFNQAQAAEAYSLNEIAGVGYRKALEFLLKDYCIKSNPADKEKIEKLALGKVIDTYLEDGKIKQAAKRTVWLGNDETHYIRKWEDKDLEDLKKLLKLTVSGIKESLEYESYVAAMPDPAPLPRVVP